MNQIAVKATVSHLIQGLLVIMKRTPLTKHLGRGLMGIGASLVGSIQEINTVEDSLQSGNYSLSSRCRFLFSSVHFHMRFDGVIFSPFIFVCALPVTCRILTFSGMPPIFRNHFPLFATSVVKPFSVAPFNVYRVHEPYNLKGFYLNS